MRSKVGRSRASLTSVAASADLKVSRVSTPISVAADRESSASLVEMRSSARRRSEMNSRIRCSMNRALSREGHIGRLEDVLVAVAADRKEAAVFKTEQPVEGAAADEVRLLKLPAERARGGLLVLLHRARDVRHVPHEVQHADRPLRAPEPQHHLVGEALTERLHRHLAGVEEVRHRLGHDRPEEVPGRRVNVVEVPAPGRGDPELGVLTEGAGDAATALDQDRSRGPELGQPDAGTGKPQLPELGQGSPVHRTRPAYGAGTSARTLSRAPRTRSRSFSCFTSMVRVDSTSSRSSASALRITSDRAQSRLSDTDGALRSSRPRILLTTATTARASRSGISGTLSRMIASSSSGGGKSMKRCRHRRLSPSDSSRALLDVS